MNPQTHLNLQGRGSHLQMSNEQIMIKLVPLAAAAAPKECRICTGSQQTDENPFVSVCNCSGSLKYIHENCLIKWMEFKMSNDGINNLQCEVCKVPLQVEYDTSLQCNSQQQIVKLIQKNCLRFWLYLGCAIASLTIAIFSLIVICVRSANNQWISSPIEQQTILIVALIAGMILTLCFTYFLLSKFLIKAKPRIIEVKRNVQDQSSE